MAISPERLFEWKSRLAKGDAEFARIIAPILLAEVEAFQADSRCALARAVEGAVQLAFAEFPTPFDEN
jgi:hypothetical protein